MVDEILDTFDQSFIIEMKKSLYRKRCNAMHRGGIMRWQSVICRKKSVEMATQAPTAMSGDHIEQVTNKHLTNLPFIFVK